MIAVASLGRLHLSSALACMSLMFQQVLPKLQSMWQEPGTGTINVADVTPEIAALLEETRLLIIYMGHLLTDDNGRKSALVPNAIDNACNDDEEEIIVYEIASAVRLVLSLAEAQASKLAENPSNARLSPNLARSFLWFRNRWAPTYICGATSSSRRPSKVLEFWSAQEAAQQVMSLVLLPVSKLLAACDERAPEFDSASLVTSETESSDSFSHDTSLGFSTNAPISMHFDLSFAESWAR